MRDEFQLLGEVIAGRTALPNDITDFSEACNRRLARAIGQQRESPSSVGPGDLAVLVRHVLRREQERQGGISPSMRVPRGLPWPERPLWESSGLEVLGESGGHFIVHARRWQPAWLRDTASNPPEKDAFAEEPRRDYGETLPGDPFMDDLPAWGSYRTAGQREAVRSVLTAPPGATLVVNLPTGVGKSLCAHLPSLIDPRWLTVVVVPTTALAIDQENALRPYLNHATAYYAEDGPEGRNAGIRERVKHGTQRIVFTSPEALLRSLAGPVYSATRSGYLRLLAIDEAHIINQWGDEFRLEFQELAGLRRDLLRNCPGELFRTLLLTGTMTEECLDTLETLFGRPGPFAMVSAVQIRPEPSYWIASCGDDQTREERVLEAVRNLPRPALLYVTKVEHATGWLGRLRAEGFSRVAAVTGRTSPAERAQIILRWRENDLDLVVATSAFGLGMDKSDVRAVIHACIPEHVDRFYQEVGRSGRDGRGSVSLLLYTSEDRDIARDLNQKAIITTAKGYERWEAMFRGREDVPDGRSRVRVDTVPEYGFGVFEKGSYNLSWNVHTLALLSRAGILELDAQPPPRREAADGLADETEQAERFQQELERHRNQRVIRILDSAHLDDGTWQTAVEVSRERTDRTARRGLELMFEALTGRRCVAGIFGDAYDIVGRLTPTPRASVTVSLSCGGCPHCRAAGRGWYVGGMPTPMPVWSGVDPDPEVGRFMEPGATLALFDERLGTASGTERQRRERLVRWLVAKGFRSVVGSPEILEWLRPVVRSVTGAYTFFSDSWEPLYLPRVPVILFSADGIVPASALPAAGPGPREVLPRVVWIVAEAKDPAKPHCRLRDTIRCLTFGFEEFCVRVGL